jgi:two-component system, NarL family, sensor histidine kinase EvgS
LQKKVQLYFYTLSFILLIVSYYYSLPTDGFQFVEHPKSASIYFGLLSLLTPITLYFVYRFFRIKVSFENTQGDFSSMIQINRPPEGHSPTQSSFLATVSHEIRNPLQAIIGNHELLLRDPNISPQNRTLLKNAYQTSKSLLSILNQVLDLSKIESGKSELNNEPTSLEELLLNTTNSFQVLCKKNSNQLNIHLDKVIAKSLMIDRTRLQQVLSNLLSNANKFTENGQILIMVSVLNDTHAEQILQFQITDTGCGIPDKDLARITQPYERSESLLHQKIPGIGLGLSITSAILYSMDSKLQLDSKPLLGTSASFRIKLKRSSSSPKSILIEPKEINSPKKQAPFAGKTALIVDDYPACREVIFQQLTYLGFLCFQASSANEGLEFFKTQQINLVITDESMPHLTGKEFARTIKQNYPQTKIIILTGDAQFENKLNQTDTDLVSAFFIKPLELNSLAHCLHKLFKHQERAWDFNRLLEFTNHDESAAQSVLQSIMLTQQEVLRELSEISSSHEQTTLKSIFHKILGGAKLINAENLMQICNQISASSDHQHAGLIEQMRITIERINQQIAEFLQQKNSDMI